MKIVVFQFGKDSSFVQELRKRTSISSDDYQEKDAIILNPREEEYSKVLPVCDQIFILGEGKKRLLRPREKSSFDQDLEKVKSILFHYPNKVYILRGKQEMKKYWKAYEKGNYLL